MTAILPFKISVLVFIKDLSGRQLLIRRRKAPNKDCWSPVGGKLEMALGESPFECAVRETGEETGLGVATTDLHLFGMISERGYEGGGHWLMFLFNCHKPLEALPQEIDEGHFGLFARSEIDALALPPTDRVLVWPVYDEHRDGFIAYRADCSLAAANPAAPVAMIVEETLRTAGK
ncbi:MAG: NUDIX domain-containing protein [Puniceicoccales bacterium]|nr:NUDIX domain-containing protein [Puniceicoccales bacterium]